MKSNFRCFAQLVPSRASRALLAGMTAAAFATAATITGVGIVGGGQAAQAAGFGFSEQGAKATGMAGAFVAQADDLSAIYYNVGGLGLLPKKKRKALQLDFVPSRLNQSLYQGLPPGIGTATTAKQATPLYLNGAAWGTLPLGPNVVGGFGVYEPFYLHTEWSNPNVYAGRFLSEKSGVMSTDLSPAIGLQISPEFGIGVSGIYRLSSLSDRHQLSGIDPSTGATLGVASLDMKTDYRGSAGWTAGFLYKPDPRFSVGASYRSAIGSNTIGTGKLTQIATGDTQLDQLVAASFPFGSQLALTSQLRFPYVASGGIAVGVAPNVLLELDYDRTGWSSVQNLDFLYPSFSVLDTHFALNFKDSSTYRAGLDIKLGQPHLRLGYSYDQSPQPAATVGAFLADSDRSTFAVGIGRDWLDLAFNWTTYKQRIITTNIDSLNGNYRTNSYLLAITVTK